MLSNDTFLAVVPESCAREVAGILVDEGIEFGVKPLTNGMSEFVVHYTCGKILDAAIATADAENEWRE